jgi:hypothetical protein
MMVRRMIAPGVVLSAAALVLFWVASFGVNVPIADDWDHVTTSIRWHDRGMDAASLFAMHNEHCLAIPRLLNHAMLMAGGGNYRLLLFGNAALGIAVAATVVLLLQRWSLPPLTFTLLAGAGAVLLTSWCQWQNWLWAFQTPWFLLPLILVMATAVIARVGSVWLAVAAAALAALLGPFCMANGLVVGLAVLPALGLRLADEPRGCRWRPAVVAVVVVVVATGMGLALLTRSRGPATGGLAALLGSPAEAARLLCVVLGSPLDPGGVFHGRNTRAALAGGLSLAVGLAAAGAILRTGRTPAARELGTGLALMIYGLASTAAVVLGRLSLLARDPVESRYQSLAIAWHVGLLLACGWLAAERGGRAWRIVVAVASIVCLGTTLTAMPLLLAHGGNMRRALETHQAIYREARAPGGREKLADIARHYGADGILARLDGMRRAGILHPDYAPAPASVHNP